MIKLNDWAVVTDDSDPFVPPECRAVCLSGVPSTHPRMGGGKRVVTSRIVAAEGRTVTTRTGSVYQLGTINPTYRAYLRKHRPNWDHRNPVQVQGGQT